MDESADCFLDIFEVLLDSLAFMIMTGVFLFPSFFSVTQLPLKKGRSGIGVPSETIFSVTPPPNR